MWSGNSYFKDTLVVAVLIFVQDAAILRRCSVKKLIVSKYLVLDFKIFSKCFQNLKDFKMFSKPLVLENNMHISY